MTEAERSGLAQVVLPRRSPGLALLERFLPSPADNVLDAELTAIARPNDTVLDPWAGTGWTARRAVAHGMRVVAADPSPFAQLAAIAFMTAPGAGALDAAFTQVAGARRVDVPLRQHLEELYATRCTACRSPVVADQFIWPREGQAPGRKVYRCAACEASIGGPTERVAAVDENDLAKLGIERDGDEDADDGGGEVDETDEELPPAPLGLTSLPDDAPESGPLGEVGGPPPPAGPPPDPPVNLEDRPRFASTVRPDPVPVAAAASGTHQSPHYLELRARFPVLDGRDDLVDELLDLFTPRNLYALHAIGEKIESELHDTGVAAVMKLALAACLLPSSRLNGYPGRVASLRIAAGHVRRPASRHQREVNVWRAFEAAYRDVRTAIGALSAGEPTARFAADFGDLGGMAATNVLWLRSRGAVVNQYLPAEGIDAIVTAPPPAAAIDELSFEYLATAWVLGREAAETLRLEPIFGGAGRSAGVEAAALRHGLSSAAATLKPGGWCSILLEGGDPERLLSAAMAGAAAGLGLEHVIHRESAAGDGVTLHLRKPSAEDRLRRAVEPGPLRLGAHGSHLTYPELATAIDRGVVELLRDRGEPAGLMRIVAAIVAELGRSRILSRLVQPRNGDGEPPADRLEGG